MSGRAAAWFRQAEADLRHARRALADGAHEWACFAAQQAAEKAARPPTLRSARRPGATS